jgi:hypothetical protein
MLLLLGLHEGFWTFSIGMFMAFEYGHELFKNEHLLFHKSEKNSKGKDWHISCFIYDRIARRYMRDNLEAFW